MEAGLVVYTRWEAVPPTLATRTKLHRQRLALPEDASGVAIFHNRYGDWALYQRDDALPIPYIRPPKDWPGLFAARYPTPRAAALDACHALWSLNRFAKHPDCSPTRRRQIYRIKDRWTRWLWEEGYCTGAIQVRTPVYYPDCRWCAGKGSGEGWTCERCGGDGFYGPVGGKPFWGLRFVVDGQEFFWHQPAHLAPWARPLGQEAPHDVVALEKPIHLAQRKLSEALRLLAWVLGPEATMQPTAGAGHTPESIKTFWLRDQPHDPPLAAGGRLVEEGIW